jgi:cell division inhibitor SepF
MWRRTMLYLGLGSDDEYDDVGEPARNVSNDDGRGYQSPVTPLRSDERRPPEREGPSGRVSVRPTDGDDVGVTRVARPEASGSVRTVPARGKPNIVSPGSFNDAQAIADRFKASQIVIVNLQGVERDLARRLIDFCSGLCYGLSGQMEKVAHQVYLLSPRDAELSDEERRRLQEQGLHR